MIVTEGYLGNHENPLDFCIRMGWAQYIYQMLVVDYLILNRDRHGANIELLIDKNGNARPAPLFDQGLSLLFSCYGNLDCIRKFDVMEDKPVNNFIGSKSTEYNLSLIPQEKIWFEGFLQKEDKSRILQGLEKVLPKEHLEKIWEMIWKRWEKYAQICHQK